MSKPLENPDLPPGAIVATFADGGAWRNDGVRLTPASQNPWYVLATVAGEQENGPEYQGVYEKNRRFWNGWMCQGMAEAERTALAQKLNLPEGDLGPLAAEEMAKVKARLWFQLIAATQAPNFSAGVWYCKVFRGRSLSWRATALSLA